MTPWDHDSAAGNKAGNTCLGAGGWWRDGWRTLHSLHIIPSSPLSQISHKVWAGARSRAINYLSASLAAAWPAWPHRGPGDPLFSSGSEECLLEAWTLASHGCREVSYPYLPSVQLSCYPVHRVECTRLHVDCIKRAGHQWEVCVWVWAQQLGCTWYLLYWWT